MRFLISSGFLIFCAALPAWGQWSFVGDALPGGPDCVQLTPNINNRRGAAWHECPLHLGAPFQLDFEMNFGGSDEGADGVCFVLQQISNLTTGPLSINGAQIGYGFDGPGGVFANNSLAIEMDTFANDGSPVAGPVNQFDDPWDHIAIFRDGSLKHNTPNELSAAVQAHPTAANIETGLNYPLSVVWNPATTLLEVYFAGSLRHSLTVDLVNEVFDGDPLVYWGFTGSTGGLSNPQSFCESSFYYSSYLNGLAVQEPAPLVGCVGDDSEFTTQPLGQTVDAVWDANNNDVLTVATAGSYPMTGFNAAGCPTHETFDIDVLDPALQLLVDPDLVVCGALEATLEATAAPDATVAWDGVEGATSVTTVAGIHDVTATLGVCSALLQVDVTFQALPDVSFSVDDEPNAGPVVICDGEPVEILAVPSEGAIASWQNSISPLLNVSQGGTFAATSTINGCESDPQSIVIEALPLAEGVFTTTPSNLCWESTGVVGFNVFNDASVASWDLPSGTTSLTAAGAGVYQANLIHDNGCESTESFNYTMLPPIVTGLVDPAPLCDEEVAVLSVTGNVDALSWNVGGNGANLPVVASMGEGPFVANVTLGECAQSDTAYVTWWPTPTVGSQPDSVSRCVLDAPYSFVWPTQTDDPVGTWIWSVNNDAATAGYSAYDEGEYLIEVRDNATGCMDSHTMHVEVLPNLNVVASAVDPLICIGDSTEVRVELLPVLDTDPYEIPFSLVWSTEGASGFENNVAGGEHYITATNACGSSVALAEVEEEYCGCHVWIPNAFTPDGDRLNEGFRIESSCEWDAFSFQVFNRWGEQVWSTENADRPWDGGAPDLGNGDHYLPDGWYPYIVKWEYREDGVFYREQKVGRILIVR